MTKQKPASHREAARLSPQSPEGFGGVPLANLQKAIDGSNAHVAICGDDEDLAFRDMLPRELADPP